jgi:CheY-like chemotaxis protein
MRGRGTSSPKPNPGTETKCCKTPSKVDNLYTEMEEESRLVCPKCGWKHVRPSPRRGIFDGLMRVFYLAPFRCRKCRLRFYRPTIFWLPTTVESVRIRPVSVVSLPETGPSILILDDDAPLRGLFRRLLERDGYQVYEAANSAEVSGEVGDETLDLIIANLNSGEKDTLGTARALQIKNPALKVIALSDAVQSPALHSEGVAILETPLHPHDLMDAVRVLLGSGFAAGRH